MAFLLFIIDFFFSSLPCLFFDFDFGHRLFILRPVHIDTAVVSSVSVTAVAQSGLLRLV